MRLTGLCSVVSQSIDSWSYDVFRLSEASGGAPLRHLGYELINRYGLFHKFKVSVGGQEAGPAGAADTPAAGSLCLDTP